MSRLRIAAALLAAAALAAWPGAAAAQYDPAFRWRTAETPHFRLHFHQGEEALAARVAEAAEAAHQRLVPLLGYAPPGPTHLVLSDDLDDANGSASPLPRNVIRLYAVPPDSASVLSDARDWVQQLVDHEYVHILHLDHVAGGPAMLNAVLGKVWTPNAFTPPWLIEGLAVAHEARDPQSGRNASALFDMWARALVVEGRGLPGLEVVTNEPLEWPDGHTRYLLGGRFLEWIERQRGQQALRDFIALQGAQFLPWAPNFAAATHLGGTFPALWADFRGDLEKRYQLQLAEVRRRPVTTPTRLTRRGWDVSRPRWTPDGAGLVYLDHGPDERGGLRGVSAAGEDLGRLTPVDLHGNFALLDGRRAVLARAQVWREFRVYDDLWLADLATGAQRRLTAGERATDPAVAPDGSAVVYVARLGGGEMALRRRALQGDELGRADTLLHRPGALLYDPAVAPDGRRIALSIHEGGRRDLYLLEGERLTRLTDDDALDLQPAWTPDGRWLLFASDRGGVFNLHAWSAETGAFRQVTNLETGALDPAVSPDGRTIAFATYGRAGFDVATLPFDPAAWLEEAPLPSPAPRERGEGANLFTPIPAAAQSSAKPLSEHTAKDPSENTSEGAREHTSLTPAGGAAASAAPLAPPSGPPPAMAPAENSSLSPTGGEGRGEGAGALPSTPYAPWTALPTFWLPIWSADAAGDTLGIFTAGQDVVGLHTWQAQGWWSLKGRTAGYLASYQGGWSWPALDLTSERLVDFSAGAPARIAAAWTPLAGGATFTFTRLEQALALRLGWSATRWDTLSTPDPTPPPPGREFVDGTLSEATFGAAWSSARRYPWSISAEEGRRLSLRLRVASRETGSDYALWRARAAWSEYLRIPGTRHAVLAARLSGGLAHGSLGGGVPFTLGGLTQPNPLDLFLLQSFSASDQLRGYPAGAFGGNGVALANLELRFPLLEPSLGHSTWPALVRRVHGAVFADVGETFVKGTERGYAGSGFRWDRLRVGAGVEARLELVLAYWLVTDLRLGLARGLGRPLRNESPTQDPAAEWQGYVTFGPSF